MLLVFLIALSACLVSLWCMQGVILSLFCSRLYEQAAYDVLAASRVCANPMHWLLTKRDVQLETDAIEVLEIMGLPAHVLKAPRIRRTRPLLRLGRKTMASYYCTWNVILVSDVAGYLQEWIRFWIMAHEMGHHIDQVTGRKGHALFALIGQESSERFADGVAWYCLDQRVCRQLGRRFGWEEFAEGLTKKLDSRASA